ncbi:MAG TPA: RimK/LysX family protein [Candidatus Saccharimonadales bacterium]|nr:RimK/LysX family protein [Candidatus Saccharimonadales bacterium]
MNNKPLAIIGRAELVQFPELDIHDVPARVDTGAKTSAIWASGIIASHGTLQCVLFGPDSPLYTGQVLTFDTYEVRTIASSIGEAEQRYVVKLLVRVKGRLIRASFSLANRSEQAYPMLIGRNILRGKFMVDVKQGTPLVGEEKARSKRLQRTHKAKK